MRRFNEGRPAESWFGLAWEPLPVDPSVLETTGVHDVDLGPLESDFPPVPGRLRPAPDETWFEDFEATPWIDELVLDFAYRLVLEEDLGADASPDLLGVSLSAP